MEAYIFTGVATLVFLVAAAIFRKKVLRKRMEQETCPYCHCNRLITGNHGKSRLSYIPRENAWRVSSDACGCVGSFRLSYCPACARDLTVKRKRGKR